MKAKSKKSKKQKTVKKAQGPLVLENTIPFEVRAEYNHATRVTSVAIWVEHRQTVAR